MDPVEPWIDADAVRRMAAQLLENGAPESVVDRPDAGFGPAFEGFVSSVPESALKVAGEEGRAVPVAPVVEPRVEQPREEVPVPAPVARRAPEVAAPTAAAEEPAPTVRDQEAETGMVVDEEPARPFLPQGPPSVELEEEAPAEAGGGNEAAESSGRGRLLARFQLFRDWLLRQSGAHGAFILDRDGNPVLEDPEYAKLHFLARSLAQAYRPVSDQAGNVHVKIGAESYLVVVPATTVFGTLVLGAVMERPLSAAAVEVIAKALAEAARPVRA